MEPSMVRMRRSLMQSYPAKESLVSNLKTQQMRAPCRACSREPSQEWQTSKLFSLLDTQWELWKHNRFSKPYSLLKLSPMWVSSPTKTTMHLQVFKEISHFVRTSTSLLSLLLSSGFTESISLEAFHFMATAIGQSSSLKTLHLIGAPWVQAQDLPHVIQSICKAAVDCASLVELLVQDGETQVRVQLMDQLHKALSLCNAAKNFDFCHRRRNESLDDNDVATLELTRPSPWWSLLSHDIPLEVWPLILAETRLWKAEERSHSTRDIVFFLMKEKSDVLLQNVKRRRIRKPKCYGF